MPQEWSKVQVIYVIRYFAYVMNYISNRNFETYKHFLEFWKKIHDWMKELSLIL